MTRSITNPRSSDSRTGATRSTGVGGISIAAVNDVFDTELERAEYETIGGLMLDRLGRAPEVGDSISVAGYRLTIEDVDGTRISTVVAREAQTEAEGEPEPSD